MGCRRPAWQQLYDAAHTHFQQGYFSIAGKEAADSYQRAQNKEPLWAWRFRILEAEALLRENQKEKSLELLQENPPSDYPAEITVRKRIVQAQVFCLPGKTANTEAAEAALKEAEALLPPNSPALEGELLFVRGRCSFDKPQVAIAYLKKAAELTRSVNPYIAASALGNIGYLMGDRLDRLEESSEWTEKATPLADAAKSQFLEEKLLGNLANNNSDLGDFKLAIDESEKAARIAAEIGQKEDEETWLVTLGRSYDALSGDYADKVEPTYQKALAIARKWKSEEIIRRCLHDLVIWSLKNNDIRKAKDYWRQLKDVVPAGSRAEMDLWLGAALIAIAEKEPEKALPILQRIEKDPRTILTRAAIAQKEMGKIYWMKNSPARAESLFQQSIQTVQKDLAQAQKKHWMSILDNDSTIFDTYIRFLASRGQRVQALEVADRLCRIGQDLEVKDLQLQDSKPRLNIAAVQRKLKSSQVILYYAVTDEKTFLWLITAKDFQLFELPSHSALNQMILRHNRNIVETRDAGELAQGELYKALVQPAEKFIPQGAHVSIVPSKILWTLNFETLMVPGQNPHFWIEDVAVQNASSLDRAVRASLAESSTGNNEMLLLGAPQEVNPSFPTLKHAAEELDRVGKHFPGDKHKKVAAGPDATPQAYTAGDPGRYRIVHFVTHGIPNELMPFESAIVLSGTDISYKLSARDIVAIPLHADLVTISSCYGAGKRWYVGVGMMGLGWAFMRAGAHQVVAALWEVDDAATPELMDNFYRGLIEQHLSAADALRQAKLAMLHSHTGFRHLPFYWGSLQLYIGA